MRKHILALAVLLGGTLLGPGPSGAAVRVSQKQGFDKCFVPTVNQMKRWWDHSPYWNVNVYIGGSVRACAQSNLTPSWVSSVHAQGWNFIPTWVGPQAPCTGYAHRISWSTATARSQGVAEADKAIAAATALGFTSPMIIYYDMEGYPDDLACYNAVNAFFDGWGARMRARGHRSGGYGSACASGMIGWGDIQNWPHTAWMAHWLFGSYRSSAGVWNVACVPNSYWTDHQRIRQYAGDHDEVWGGVTFTIDSNALDGMVQGSNDHGALAPLVAEDRPAVRDAVVLADRTGARRSFARPAAGVTLAGLFHDARRGVVATATPPDAAGEVRLLANLTSDGGATWRESVVHTFRAGDGDLLAGPAWVDFVDERAGWLAVRLASSANFSRGLLFATADGGQTWQPRALPTGDRVRFVDPLTGWTAGGPGGGELHVTRDGGRTWSLVEGPFEGIDPGEAVFQGVPAFTGELDGVLPITVASEARPRVHLYTTRDQGQTWTLARSLPLADVPGTAAPVAIADAATWFVVDPAADTAYVTGPGAEPPAALAWPGGILELEFESARTGWIRTASGSCTGDKRSGTFECDETRRVLQTSDGGRTWTETKADADPADPAAEPDGTSEGGGCSAAAGGGGFLLAGLALLLRRRRARC